MCRLFICPVPIWVQVDVEAFQCCHSNQACRSVSVSGSLTTPRSVGVAVDSTGRPVPVVQPRPSVLGLVGVDGGEL